MLAMCMRNKVGWLAMAKTQRVYGLEKRGGESSSNVVYGWIDDGCKHFIYRVDGDFKRGWVQLGVW